MFAGGLFVSKVFCRTHAPIVSIRDWHQNAKPARPITSQVYAGSILDDSCNSHTLQPQAGATTGQRGQIKSSQVYAMGAFLLYTFLSDLNSTDEASTLEFAYSFWACYLYASIHRVGVTVRVLSALMRTGWRGLETIGSSTVGSHGFL